MSGWSSEWDALLGLKGPEVYIGRYCEFVFPDKVHLRGKVRIDPFFLSTCGIVAQGYNHICAHSAFNGGADGLVVLNEWAFVGWGSRVFTASDDYTGEHGPHGPFGKNLMHRGDVIFEPYSGVASGSTVMPGVRLPEGCVIGAHSYVSSAKDLEPWMIHVGVPARPWKKRHRESCIEKALEWERPSVGAAIGMSGPLYFCPSCNRFNPEGYTAWGSRSGSPPPCRCGTPMPW